jgi:hypothetical protein
MSVLIGYVRGSKSDGSQALDLQWDALFFERQGFGMDFE